MTALAQDSLLPRPPGGMAPGAALALAVHLGLLVALTAAVDWRTSTPQVSASAELWASVPQAAAPRPVEPTPVPTPTPPPRPAPVVKPEPPAERARPDADISIERENRRKAEARRQAEERREAERREAEAKKELAEAEQKKRDAAARQAKADEARLAQQREENLKRIIGTAGGTASGGSGTAARDAAPSNAYAGRLVALIRSNIVFTSLVEDNVAAEVEVRAGPAGTIISRRLIKSSGWKDWDDAVLRAIDRTVTLPRDSDGRVPPTIIISFKPRE